MLDRLRVGIYLARIALDSYGTSRFWDVIGWWHGEVHYTIPRVEEERRVSAELERAFTDTSAVGSLLFGGQVLTPTGYTTPAVEPSLRFGDASVVYRDGRMTLDSGKKVAGEWRWQGFAVRVTAKPNPVRRILISVLTGAEWVADKGDNKKAQVSLAPEYDRLSEFLTPTR